MVVASTMHTDNPIGSRKRVLRFWLIVTLPALVAIAMTGCVSVQVRQITGFSMDQQWFDEAKTAAVVLGSPTRPIDSAQKTVFLEVKSEIPDNAPILKFTGYDANSNKVIPTPVGVHGGIKKAVEDRIRRRLVSERSVTFVDDSSAADIKISVNIAKAGMETLKNQFFYDTRNKSQTTGEGVTKQTAFLSVATSVNGKDFSYYNTVDRDEKRSGGFSSGFPKYATSATVECEIMLGDRTVCVYAESVRHSLTYAVVANIPKYEGYAKIVFFTPDQSRQEITINGTDLQQYGQLIGPVVDDWSKIGASLQNAKNVALLNMAPYGLLYTTPQGQLMLLVNEYINSLIEHL